MSHYIYDINEAFDGFVKRFGIEPNGVLMSEETFQEIKHLMSDATTIVAEDAKITFRGVPIFMCSQLSKGKLRFVI